MIITKAEMNTETWTHARGGEGEISILHFADQKNLRLKNIRIFSRITIPPSSSIGLHRHENETEYFLILQGRGVVSEDCGETPVKPGDFVITRSQESHSIRNVGLQPLEFIAVVVLD